MSFIASAFAPRPLHSREEFMATFIQVAKDLGMPDIRGAAVCAGMCALQEAGAEDDEDVRQIWTPGNDADPCFHANPTAYPHDSMGDDGLSTGSFQQQMGDGWGWGGAIGDCDGTRKRMDMVESTRMFYSWPGSGLRDKGYSAINASAANDSIQEVQQSGAPYAYAQWWDQANALYDQVAGGVAVEPPHDQPGDDDVSGGFTGDPVWLEEVLRDALGDRLVVEDGWADRGTGSGENGSTSMGPIFGVMIHHTGNDRETVAGIRDGRSDLTGPLSQGLITPDGIFHLIAVGPCNHAGIGSYPGIPDNMGNTRLIGFECAWPTIRADGSYDPGQRWPDAQVITMRDATTAVLAKLDADQSHVIGHKEYATAPPNVKWDPGNMDMNWFRGEVAKDLAGQFDPKPADPPPVDVPPPPPTTIPPDFDKQTYLQINGRWEMLGWRTVVEALAVLLDAATGTHDVGKRGFKLGTPPAGVDL